MIQEDIPTTLQELFADPAKWTQQVLARDDKGRSCDTADLDACQFCLIGGLILVYQNSIEETGHYYEALRKTTQALSDLTGNQKPNVSVWNDQKERTIEDIQALIKKAGV